MIKKTVTYTDFNGIERTEDFYFNLTQAELTELELGTNGGYAEMLEKIVKSNDAPTIIRTFKDVVLKAYGVKSDDGRRFIKSDELSKAFTETMAYSQIFMELATDNEAAQAFINGVIPEGANNDKNVKALASGATPQLVQ